MKEHLLKQFAWKVGFTFLGISLLLFSQWLVLENKITVFEFSALSLVIWSPLAAWNVVGLRRDSRLWKLGDRSSSVRVGGYSGMLIIPLVGLMIWSVFAVLFKLHLVSGGVYFLGRIVGRMSFVVMGIAIVWMDFKNAKSASNKV